MFVQALFGSVCFFGSIAGSLATPLLARSDPGYNQCPYYARDLVPRAPPQISFANSDWIWTSDVSGGNADVGTRAFRKTFSAPNGKTLSYLSIAYAVDNSGVMWVNGNQISTQVGWQTAGSVCVKLEPECDNVIAVSGTNGATTPNPAGLLVSAVVTYTDGSTSNIVSDGSWRADTSVPDGFQSTTFDDSLWPAATVEGGYPMAPWNNVALAGTDAISFAPSQWMWTSELSGGDAPVGARPFRYTLPLSPGHNSASAEIIIVVDNEYSLYANGAFVGSGTDFHTAQRYTVNNLQGNEVVFAIYAQNTETVPNPAAILASIQVTSRDSNDYCLQDCVSTYYVVSGTSWKTTTTAPPTGFEQTGFDDSSWSATVAEGTNGVAPWGTIAVPTADTTGTTPIAGSPAGN